MRKCHIRGAGLQGLGASDVVGQLQILGNPRLTDISALDPALQCQDGQPEVLDPKTVLGVIEVIPEQHNPNGTSCLISNAGQVSCLLPWVRDIEFQLETALCRISNAYSELYRASRCIAIC